MFTRITRRANQCQRIGKTDFVKVLTPLLKSALNICGHRKVILTRKVYRSCCYHFGKWKAMNLSLKTSAKWKRYIYFQNSCTTWKLPYWIKLFIGITLHLRRCNYCWAMKRRISHVVRLDKAVFEIDVIWKRTMFKPSTAKANKWACTCLVITRQLLQLERCSNPLRIQQV